ncbi:uncharacterized protein A4U43_C01F11510 [Asparagus officinalis]|uniref:ATPase AAA-type core domain-containing protein n=1 Tax=Asparagus officinalis TaxID=4686 RepID=A0A5P1FNK1_ASPOF|nr:uncharacterized protein A4U43_C01F11510 [Asparagus officinalis]
MEMERWAGFGSEPNVPLLGLRQVRPLQPRVLLQKVQPQDQEPRLPLHPDQNPRVRRRPVQAERGVRGDRVLPERVVLAARQQAQGRLREGQQQPRAELDDHEEVTDEFEGVKLWWASSTATSRAPSNPFSPAQEERRSYKLTFHKRHRTQVIASYLQHVMAQGRELLIETTSKSIILIEDIDCSLELTGKRKKKADKESEGGKPALPSEDDKDDGSSKVTLSGLLNFIDGLWSASAGERLIVFTTNHIEKLDPALIRRGRMDKHIEMSYCSFEAFQVLVKNYLGIDSHEMFDRIRGLMEEVKITPADVAENLMPKSVSDGAETCLNRLIQALSEAKEAALRGAESRQEEINGEKSKTDGDDENKELQGAENSTT